LYNNSLVIAGIIRELLYSVQDLAKKSVLPHTSRVEIVKSCPNRPKGPILTVVKAKIDVNIFNSEMDNNVIVSNITTYEKFTIKNQKSRATCQQDHPIVLLFS
jgi:pyruvoyl-dependent arginine decarboxylase (PvlArgDC)